MLTVLDIGVIVVLLILAVAKQVFRVKEYYLRSANCAFVEILIGVYFTARAVSTPWVGLSSGQGWLHLAFYVTGILLMVGEWRSCRSYIDDERRRVLRTPAQHQSS